MCKHYGYIRTSCSKQDFEAQQTEINLYCERNKIALEDTFSVQVSSRKGENERGVTELLNRVKKNDVIYFSEMSRLSRSMFEAIRIIEQFSRKGVDLVFIKQNLVIRDIERDITSKMLISNFAMAAEIERDFISKRTKAGMEAARARGKQIGNPNIAELNRGKQRKASEFSLKMKDIVRPMIDAGMTQRKIVEALNEADIKTSRGAEWRLITLQRVIARWDEAV
jgi:DNA invertase Pin-like site-specific DNA recombinase